MGKKQHSKDRLFITRTEWATEWGGAKQRDVRIPFKRLPFYCCALTFTPFSDPMCTKQGHVFELMHIVPYIQKHKKNPVTGEPLGLKDLIKLEFHKNADGEYHCPVLHKVFTEFTHIVAIKTTGNVFSYEAVKELNLKAKNWRELLTDEPFTRDDIITIQDPNELDSRALSKFDHVEKEIDVESEEMRKMKEDPGYYINMSEDTKRMLRDLGTEKAKELADQGGGGGKAQTQRAAALAAVKAAKENTEAASTPAPAMSIVDKASAALRGKTMASAKGLSAEKSAALIAAHAAGERVPVNTQLVKTRYSSGAASRSLTSTTYAPVTTNEEEYVKAEKNPKKKGYAKLQTTHGELNIELHCDMAPRTCENFLTLCERGYYDGVIFHRNIRNFMIQGGDPTGTGRGGQSIWGKSFKDEFHPKLEHSGRGVLSMANSGPHSNGSQFFILYKSAPHLNRKHTVFGNVVGGIEVLSIMDKVPVDEEDRPLEELKILKASVYVNPYTEPDEPEEKQKIEEADTENDKVGSWYSNPPVSSGGAVAKYLKSSGKLASALLTDEESLPRKKSASAGSGVAFKDFSKW